MRNRRIIGEAEEGDLNARGNRSNCDHEDE